MKDAFAHGTLILVLMAAIVFGTTGFFVGKSAARSTDNTELVAKAVPVVHPCQKLAVKLCAVAQPNTCSYYKTKVVEFIKELPKAGTICTDTLNSEYEFGLFLSDMSYQAGNR